ncbi:uncharacterized protein PGRI_095250 [Penicillium griseofulvum]|uniref:Uncharacterized protein n=1 Tax=Penicillium patulum TaxID=5078 RepID=A0A135LQL6_PENPA|nr:uncharacterized protein PGRI_095250 [Penicillium griseofulvum]KXG51264.1 hypothetical protein PGRI_095250 [Penicillium griseofulvum]
MNFINHLPVTATEGIIDDIKIQWTINGTMNLPGNAGYYKTDLAEMKRATEYLAHSCVKRLGKTRVRIVGSFHKTTTSRTTHE